MLNKFISRHRPVSSCEKLGRKTRLEHRSPQIPGSQERLCDQTVDDLSDTEREKSKEVSAQKAPSVTSVAGGVFDEEVSMYALFEGKKQIGSPFPTEKEVWEAALIEGLVTDVPVADEEGGQILPRGYRVARLDEGSGPRRERPRRIS